jgi:hypothetical protein
MYVVIVMVQRRMFYVLRCRDACCKCQGARMLVIRVRWKDVCFNCQGARMKILSFKVQGCML